MKDLDHDDPELFDVDPIHEDSDLDPETKEFLEQEAANQNEDFDDLNASLYGDFEDN